MSYFPGTPRAQGRLDFRRWAAVRSSMSHFCSTQTQLRSVDHCCATPCEVIVNYSQGRGGEQRAQAESSRELRQVTFPFFSFPNLMLEEGFKELGATESGREREVGFRGFI